MVTSEERLKILQMLQDGVISADEAARLLEDLGGAAKAGPPPPQAPPPPPGAVPHSGGPGRWMRVRVTDTDSGKVRVNVRLPVGLIGSGLRMGMRFAPHVEGMDPDALFEAIRAGEQGQIVDIYDDEDGEHVEVFIE